MSLNIAEIADEGRRLGMQAHQLRHEDRERLEQEARYRLQYPSKLHFRDKFYPGGTSASELVRKALQDGLDPNTHWSYEEIIDPGADATLNKYGRTWKRWNTPLHLALLCFDYESARVILRHGGDPDIHNGEGRTTIHEAIKLQNLENIRFLTQHGANLNGPSQDGLVPLHAALYEGDEEIFSSLIKDGATLEAAAYDGWSITDLALLALEKSILERLTSEEYGQLPTPLMQSPRASPNLRPQDIALSAHKLLAVVSSKQVLPEKALYETYHHLVAGLNISQHQRWDAVTINGLIDNMTKCLHGITQRPRSAFDENFCSGCLKFQSFIEAFSRERAAAKWESYRQAIDIHKSRQELDNCALSGCPICLAISENLKARKLSEGDDDHDLEISPFVSSFSRKTAPGIGSSLTHPA